MTELILTTFEWVPEAPRGWVRDLRVRWALEEAGLPYRIETVPRGAGSAEHFAHQPFGQVPWLIDGDLSIFESGAILLYLGEKSETLMPTDPQARSNVTQWVFAALNSVEMAILPWGLFHFTGNAGDTPMWKFFDDWVTLRVGHMEQLLTDREWLAGHFSIADILMADVLRLADAFDGLSRSPACRRYVARATARPAFIKAHADQLAHFAAADERRSRGQQS